MIALGSGRTALAAVLAVSGCTVAAPAHASELAFPDRGRAAVVDAAHVMPFNDAAALNRRIVAWDQATGHQLAVATVPSLQGREIADFGYRLGRAWGLGRKGVDDGILLLIAPAEHKVRIDVGRGLEGDLTDADTSVILARDVVPRLKAGDMGGAAAAGADAIMAAVPAGAGDVANAPRPGRDWGWWLGAALMIAGGRGLAPLRVLAWRKQRKLKSETDERRADAIRFRDTAAEIAERGVATSIGSSDGDRLLRPRFYDAPPPTVIVLSNPPYRSSPDPSWPTSSSDGGSSAFGSSDAGPSSSSADWGSSSSGFDSGGGTFSGGGSDSSW